MVPPNLPPWYLWFPEQSAGGDGDGPEDTVPELADDLYRRPVSSAGNGPTMQARSLPARAPFGGNMTGSGFRPTGYTPQPQIPAYWYGR